MLSRLQKLTSSNLIHYKEIQQSHILSKSNEHYSNLLHWHKRLEENRDTAVKEQAQAHPWLPKASPVQTANVRTRIPQLENTPIVDINNKFASENKHHDERRRSLDLAVSNSYTNSNNNPTY